MVWLILVSPYSNTIPRSPLVFNSIIVTFEPHLNFATHIFLHNRCRSLKGRRNSVNTQKLFQMFQFKFVYLSIRVLIRDFMAKVLLCNCLLLYYRTWVLGYDQISVYNDSQQSKLYVGKSGQTRYLMHGYIIFQIFKFPSNIVHADLHLTICYLILK